MKPLQRRRIRGEEQQPPTRLGETKEDEVTNEEGVEWDDDNSVVVATELLIQELDKDVTNEVKQEIEEKAAVAEIRDGTVSE